MIGKKVTFGKYPGTPRDPLLGSFWNGNRPSASGWIQSVGYSFYIIYKEGLRPRKIQGNGNRTFRDRQLLCLRDSACNGLRHNGHVCDLLIDPTCGYISSFTATGPPPGNTWHVQSLTPRSVKISLQTTRAVPVEQVPAYDYVAFMSTEMAGMYVVGCEALSDHYQCASHWPSCKHELVCVQRVHIIGSSG